MAGWGPGHLEERIAAGAAIPVASHSAHLVETGRIQPALCIQKAFLDMNQYHACDHQITRTTFLPQLNDVINHTLEGHRRLAHPRRLYPL